MVTVRAATRAEDLTSAVRPRPARSVLTLIILLIAAVVALGLGAAVGSVTVGWRDLLSFMFTGHAHDPTTTVLLAQIRMPRVITAGAVGAGLAVAGLLMQTLFANPLADPYVLGVSSGASLGVALVTLGTGTFTSGFVTLVGGARFSIVIAAAAGSAAVLMLILVLGRWVRSVVTLLIIGVMLSSAIGAITSLLLAFADPDRLQRFVLWGLGSFGGVTQGDLAVLLPLIIGPVILSGLLARSLNAMLLGELYARSMGVRAGVVRTVAMILTAIITGTVTAYCGPIAFLGLAVPHLARLVIGSSDHRVLLPATIGMGVITASVCSVIAQLPGDTAVLPINVTTALVGAPVVIMVLLRSRRLSAGAV